MAAPNQTSEAGGRTLRLEQLVAHPMNIRDNDGDLAELAASIRSLGVLQPLLVTPKGDRYEVICGHRRMGAAAMAGLDEVPVVVRLGITGHLAFEAMLVENLHRKAINPIEEAQAFQALIDIGRTQVQIAASIGKTQSHVSTRLDLLLLGPHEQKLVATRQLTVARARSMAVRARGPKRSDSGEHHDMSHRVPHFNTHHPLFDDARVACKEAGHPNEIRIGPACGPCWEAAVRRDERARSAGRMVAGSAPQPEQLTSAQEALLLRMVCRRCQKNGRFRHMRCVVEADGRLRTFVAHDYVVLTEGIQVVAHARPPVAEPVVAVDVLVEAVGT